VVRSPNWTESWKVSMDYQGKRTVLNRVSLLSMCFTTHLFTFYLNFLHTNPCLFPSTKPENSFFDWKSTCITFKDHLEAT